MPKYKLHYFNLRGRGEIVRLVLTVAGQEFEDHRFGFEEWPQIKTDMPSGQVPALEVDEKLMNESIAVARYISREYGIGGKSNYEQYLIDRVLGAVEDLYMKAREIIIIEKDETKKAVLEQTLDNEHIPRYLGLFTRYLEESGGNGVFFVGNSVTLADLAVHDVLTTVLQRKENLLEKYPKLKANRSVIEALPNLADYLSKRPQSPI